MKRWLVGVGVIAVTWGAVRAAGADFSRTIRAEEFAAAGLGKLSAEELRRLDALVRDFKSGALERAQREAAVAQSRAADAEARAQASARAQNEKASDAGLLAKAKVRLTPGTQVEFATVESRIAGEFRGWEGRTVFTLENGQRWQVAGGESYASPALTNPAVKITPGMLGSFWLTVEGVRTRVKVVPVGSGK